MTDILICDADISCIDRLEALEEECFSSPWTREQLIGQLPDEMHIFLVAKNAEEIVGYAGMMTVLDEGYISNVAVSAEYRRQGIADRLLDEIDRRAKSYDLAFITLEVRKGNLPAIALYEKHGFIPVGERKNYYQLPTENAILMTKFLK